MSDDRIQYISPDKLEQLRGELRRLKEDTIPGLAKRIDEARQMGDLSENAEYHAAREEMAWAQSRAKELVAILENVQTFAGGGSQNGIIGLGSAIVVKVRGVKKEFTIVGAQEADPGAGKISNESPLGQAFLGKRKGDTVEIRVPAGTQVYEIVQVG